MRLRRIKLKLIAVLTLTLVLIPWPHALFWQLKPVKKVEAASKTLTSRANFDAGLHNATEANSKEGDLKLIADGNWGETTWKSPDLVLGDQAAITSDGNYVYMLHNGDNHFVRYLPNENRWQTLADAPHYGYYGASLVVLGNYIYAIYGGYQKEFSRYSIIDDTWTERAQLLDLVWHGASLTTDGTYIYALRGSATQDFWRYNPSQNLWETMASPISTMYQGSAIIYYDGNIYALRGYNSNTVYRYNISSNTWYTTTVGGAALASVPATIYTDMTITIRGDQIFVARGYGTKSFYKYDISDNSWTTLTNTPQTNRYVGCIYNSSDDYVYVFRGDGTYDFWKFDPDSGSTGTFLGLTDLPNTPGSGADLIWLDGYLYYLRGNSSQNFYRFNGTSWETLSNTLATFSDDTKGATASGKLYFYRGGNTRTFYSYNPTNGSWTQLADTDSNVYLGAALVYPGSGDYIYGTRGNNTATFWRYSISGNSWNDASVADLPDNAESGYGSRLMSNGNDIFYITGYQRAQFLKYSIANNNWTVLSSLPFAPLWGTDMVYYNGKIYVQAGHYKEQFWEYVVATNTWRRLPDLQTHYANDLGPYNGGSLESDNAGNIYSISGQNILRMDVYTPSSYNYPTSGIWTSAIQDFTYVNSWSSLIANATTPDDSSISYEARSSDDKINWTGWYAVIDGVFPAEVTANRYLQLRVTLNASSDRSQTPILHSLTINYLGDEQVPTNPSNFTGVSQTVGGVNLISGSSYGYTHPYFSWDSGTDSETEVDGYYVYFGTNLAADPETEGSFQTAQNYLVTSPMSIGTYYLRLQTKDAVGNISNAITGFIYSYNGISPTYSLTQTSSVDFSNGILENTSAINDEIKLASKSGFWLEERLSNTPSAMYNGAALAYVSSSNKMYSFRGNSQLTFYEYDLTTNVWATKANAPNSINYGGGVIEGPDGYLFALRGLNTFTFWRYDIVNNEWNDGAAADPPQSASAGTALLYDGSQYIYMLRGNSDDAFLRYDTLADSWESKASVDFGAPITQSNNLVYYGGDLAYDGEDTIYAIQGNTLTGFSSYSITNNTWTPLTNVPAKAYYGAQIEYDNTTNSIYYLPGWDKSFFYKYDISNQTWSRLSDAPGNIGYGGSMRNVNGELYILRGANTTVFYKYDIAKDSWLVPTVGLFGGAFRGTDYRTYGYGAEIVKGDGDNYYLVRGNYDNIFIRYNAVTGESTQMADAPAGFYLGGSMTYDSTNNKIYAICNSYYRKLFVYDIATDVWTEETADPPPVDASYGSDLEYDNSRYIYWIPGGGTQTFYRFDTQGTTGNKWGTALANTPSTMSYGADLVVKDDYLYATRGNNQLGFYRYGPLSGTATWNDSAVADLPTGGNIYYDGFLVDGGGDYLYACRGANTRGCYRYSISGNSWAAISDAPDLIYTGGAAASNRSDRILVIAGAGSNTFSNGLYTYIMQTNNSAFEESGTFTSTVHDLTSVYRYANLSVIYTDATNSALTISTRTSADNVEWNNWTDVSEEKHIGTTYLYKIGSPTNRYLQVKFTFTSSDGVYSGAVSDYTVNYYVDNTAPENPADDGFSAYTTATASANLTTNTWANYSNPYFTWAAAEAAYGASDGTGGSGIAGYYVYFGTDSQANASESGTLVTDSEYTASNLTSGETYYLRIQAVDEAGNFSDTNWQPFIYKFDNTPPENPSTVVVNPSGYTNVNDYTFTWSGATDSASLIKQYWYKAGPTGTESATLEATASGVTKYTTGANTFYLQAQDHAGNRAASWVTASYYYSGTAAGAPQNLRITHPSGSDSNTVNEFAFAWDPPSFYFGQQASLRYHYWINRLPSAGTAENATGLAVAYLSKGAYAQDPGENTLYVVAEDEAGNIDYNNYASITFTSSTSAPGAPRNLDISDVSIKETEAWRLALSWDQPSSSGSGIAEYRIYRSEVEDAECDSEVASDSDFSYIASTTQTSYVDTGLVQETKYYCIAACNYPGGKGCGVSSDTVSLYPDGRWRVAPSMTASPSAAVKTKTATISWSTNRTSNSFVKYGKSSGDYGEETGSSTQVTAHEVTLTGLDPGTTYYYKAIWTDEDGNNDESDELTFTTNPAPTVSTVSASNVSIYGATIGFTIANAIKATVEYGLDLNYGGSESISTSKNETTYSITLSNLTEGTAYNFRIKAEDDEGNVYYSDNYTFETLPVPKITTLKIQQVVGMPKATLRLIWTTNTSVSSIVTYYPSAFPERAKDYINLALKTSHEAILMDLNDETEYTLIVSGKDLAGNEATYPVQKVKTATDFRAPLIENFNIETTIVGVGDEARAKLVITWDTDEPATTQVEYAQGTSGTYSQTTQEDRTLTSNHTVTITGLMPSTIYHLRAISKDKAKNTTRSQDTVIITPKSTKGALELVVENLSKSFGFLRGVNVK